MIVICDNCGHKNLIKNYEAFRGMKNVVFTCKNKSCKEKVKFFLPAIETSSEKKDITIAIEPKVKIENAFLVYSDENGIHHSYEIKKGINNIGRKATGYNQEIAVETDDRHMSRMHAVIISKETNSGIMCVLRDYNSKNKVKLNGKTLDLEEEIFLVEGDAILLGSTIIKYKTNYNGED